MERQDETLHVIGHWAICFRLVSNTHRRESLNPLGSGMWWVDMTTKPPVRSSPSTQRLGGQDPLLFSSAEVGSSWLEDPLSLPSSNLPPSFEASPSLLSLHLRTWLPSLWVKSVLFGRGDGGALGAWLARAQCRGD